MRASSLGIGHSIEYNSTDATADRGSGALCGRVLRDRATLDRGHRCRRAAAADRDRAVRRRKRASGGHLVDRARRPRAQRPVPRGRGAAALARADREHAGQLRRVALAPRRRAGAGIGEREPGRPLRGALPRVRHRQAGALGGVAYTLTPSQVRATAHRISDMLRADRREGRSRPHRLRGEARHALRAADRYADGAGEETALASFEPTIRRRIPDGKRLAYVSFENKKWSSTCTRCSTASATSRRIPLELRAGWSPDGSKLRSRSRDGGSQLFLINAADTCGG